MNRPYQAQDSMSLWWLADVQALGRARKTEILGNGDEVTEVTKFHGCYRFKV